jgi:epidermal growth factor receptor substrate 15
MAYSPVIISGYSFTCGWLTNGLGDNAKQIFEKAKLPNETLGRIWNLADMEQRGALGVTEFIIAMHLLASVRTGAMTQVPTSLPPGLYEAARRGANLVQGRHEPAAPILRQFSGAGSQRNQSPLGRAPYSTPPTTAQQTGGDWAISPQEKQTYDNRFSKVDTLGRGFITGEQAVQFFSDSGLPEDVLAGIWDLADINSEGQLNKDEFAVAMFLIRQQRQPGATLPSTLPQHLIPPTMRNGPPPIPAQEPAPFAVPQPKSAADDLFGLDAFSAPASAPTQNPQLTGGSFSKPPFDNDPFASKTTSPTSPHPFQPVPRNPASTFKPFLPTSSFGQTLASQSTGQSSSSQPQTRQQPSAMDDLLGESDPDINKKLTQDSTELANMSNQMSTLRTQMQEVQNKKVTTESDVNSISTQKRDLELRLSQFKSQYEQEVKAMKALEDKLATSRNEARKLQQELAMVEGTYQDLQTQHREVGSALEADQRENINLKERIRQVNQEISQLRPQLDKMRSDARQQKGMVAINKKQLVTNEGERDRIRTEMNELSKAAEEPVRSPPTQTPNVVSPATSTASHNTNPFFRKSPPPAADNSMSPSGFSQGPHRDFDSVFANSFAPPQTAAPPTSFRSDIQTQVPQFSGSVRSSDGPDVPTPSTSPPLSSYQESPRTGEPSAPPESRQFASSFLPLRDTNTRSESFSSSVKASAPASRYGGPGNETPTVFKASPAGTPVPEKPNTERSDTSRTETDPFGSSLFNRTASPVASIRSDAHRAGSRAEDRKDTFGSFGGPLTVQDIPGAFPRDPASPLQQMPTGESSMSNQSRAKAPKQNRAEPFAPTAADQPRGGASNKVDFDVAFAGFGGNRQFPDTNAGVNGNKGPGNRFNKEFPPIENLAHDDSDSNSEHGFEDNFTSASPQQQRVATGAMAGGDASADNSLKAPPPTTRLDSNTSGLPTPNAQQSPPSYDQVIGPARGGSNQFPHEFGGLLPARTDPTSAPAPSQSPERSFSQTSAGSQGAALFGGFGTAKPTTTSPPPAETPSSTVPSDAYHSAASQNTGDNKGASPPTNPPQTARPTFHDDFDAGFDDLTDAKETDDKTDDDFMVSSQHHESFDEFNPVFDSPAASKTATLASQQTPTNKTHGEDSFGDFDHLAQSFGQPKAQPSANSSHDWDAIFSGLDAPKNEGASQQPGDLGKSVFDNLDREEPGPSSSKSLEAPPQLGRALSSGTEHDDPILKKLTNMGYPRVEALSALEKYDYDINKVGTLST